MKSIIAVCGSDGDDPSLTKETLDIAEQVGREIAKRNCVLVCGGRDGVMKAACKGALEEHGITVGILPTIKEEANEFVEIAIPTDLGHKRNFLVVLAGDVVVALCGRWGTLNEISYAMILHKPVVLIRGTGGCVDELIEGHLMKHSEAPFYVKNSAQKAVEKAFELLKTR
jgi:hypothetical protein